VTPSNPANEYDYLLGDTLDNRYLIEALVGIGGMGVVFRARHVLIDKTVAIKFLRREVATNQDVVTRFMREAKAASRIGHPNIIDVTDFGVSRHGLNYQVMEFIDGPTLGEVPWKHEIPRALPMCIQIARALSVAHQKGIVHRDLKPDNVFVLERGGLRDFVKIADFGVAKVFPVEGSEMRRLTRVGSVFGTPEYMAPEQALGMDDVDHRVDVYALGTILYECITGRVPFIADTPVDTIVLQVEGVLVPPRKLRPDLPISEELENIVMCALARDREERFSNMNALANALEHALGIASRKSTESGRTKTEAGARPKAPSFTQFDTIIDLTRLGVRDRRWWLTTALAATTIIAIILVFLAYSSDDEVEPVTAVPAPEPVSAPVSAPAPEPVLVPVPMPGADLVEVTVITDPTTGKLYLDNQYAGTGGVSLKRARGTQTRVTCRRSGYNDGTVQVRFDGTMLTAVCKMSKCVAELKNPFAKCR
jgi:serine/threonine-protein kinase